MSKPTASDQGELDELHASFYGWMRSIKNVAAAEPLMGFILAAQWIDAVARLHAGRELGKEPPDGVSAWRGFFKAYLPAYREAWEALYRRFRSPITHNFSIKDFNLTEHYPDLHWSEGASTGNRLVNLSVFLSDLEAAYKNFRADLQRNAAQRARTLECVRENPPIGIVMHEPTTPVATPYDVVKVSGTGAIAASGTGPPAKKFKL